MLRAAQLVVAAVEATTRTVTRRALRDGADFAQIGAAEGISRQAARQRHRRHSAQRLVRLVGGPRDGKHASAFGATREIRHGEAAGPWDEDREVTEVTSVYRAKYGSPEVFEFHHYEDLNGNTMTEWDRRPRVHQLARYWCVDAPTVLAQARALDPRVKTPSSRVELSTFDLLRDVFGSRRHAGDPSASADEPTMT